MQAGNRPKWMPWVIVGLIVAIFFVWQAAPSSAPPQEKLDYGDFLTLVTQDHVASIKYDVVERQDHRRVQGRLHEERPEGVHDPGPADHAPRRRHQHAERAQRLPQLQAALERHPRHAARLSVAARPDRRHLVLHRAPRAGPDGRGDEHRALARQGVQHRQAQDDVRRRRRLRRGEGRDHRSRRLLEAARQVQGDRRAHPEGRAARRSARHR